MLGLFTLVVAITGLALTVISKTTEHDVDAHLEGSSGRSYVLALATGCIFFILGVQKRDGRAYGLHVGEHWLRQMGGAFLLTLAALAAHQGLAVRAEAIEPDASVTMYRWISSALTAMLAFLAASLQEIVFRGYLWSVAQRWLGGLAATLLIALVFALSARLEPPMGMLSASNLRLLAGLMLLGTLLGLMRWYHGSILAGIGVAAGWLFFTTMMRKTRWANPDNDVTSFWLAPVTDPRQSLLLSVVMGVGIAVYAALLVWRGPAAVSTRPAEPSASFNKFFPFSNLAMFAPLDLWLRQLWVVRFRVGPIYWLRLAATLLTSAVNTVISLPERLLLPILLCRKGVPDPVIVVGAHRSGTTHLHYLLSLDPQFCSPRNYQVINPIGFLFSGWLIVPVLGLFMPWRRPMDQVSFTLFSPQEDEFALAHSCPLSPHWAIAFPRHGRQFDRFLFADQMTAAERETWKRKLLLFLRKLCLFSRGRPLLKNPNSTGRLRLLRELFPQARFVHIYRNPFAVHRSCGKLASTGHALMQLQDAPADDDYADRYLDNYVPMEQAFYRDAAELPAGTVTEVRFEDLETDPMGQLERMYGELGMAMSAPYRERLQRYLASVADYRKNVFKPLPEEERQRVYGRLQWLFTRWGYDPSPPA